MTLSVPISVQVFCVGCGKTGLKPGPGLAGWLAVAPDGSAICDGGPEVLEAFQAEDTRIQIGPTDI